MIYELLSRGFAHEVTIGKCVFMTKVAPQTSVKAFWDGLLEKLAPEYHRL